MQMKMSIIASYPEGVFYYWRGPCYTTNYYKKGYLYKWPKIGHLNAASEFIQLHVQEKKNRNEMRQDKCVRFEKQQVLLQKVKQSNFTDR